MNDKLIQTTTSLALATGLLLLIPLIAMQFTSEVTWTLFDFMVAGLLIFGSGFIYKLITIKTGNHLFKIATAVSMLSGLFLIWSNLAVGIIGSEDNTFNLLYFAVISVGIIGAIISRLQANKLALTLFAMAFTQLVITLIAFITGQHHSSGSDVFEILAVNGFFITLFVAAAYLYKYAE